MMEKLKYHALNMFTLRPLSNDLLINGTILSFNFYTVAKDLHILIKIINQSGHDLLISPSKITVITKRKFLRPDFVMLANLQVRDAGKIRIQNGQQLDLKLKYRVRISEEINLLVGGDYF